MSRLRPSVPWFRFAPVPTSFGDCDVDSSMLADSSISTLGLQDCAVTYPKIQNVTARRLLGRYDAVNGVTQEIAIAGGLTFDSDAGTISSDTTTTTTVLTVGAANSDYTTDGIADNVQIQAAIDALPSTGGEVLIKNGTYDIAVGIIIAKTGVILRGEGSGTILTLANTVNDNVIELGSGATAYNSIKVRDIRINGNSANNSGTSHGIYISAGVSYYTIQNCYINDTEMANIYDNGASYGTISNNYCSTTSSVGNFANIEGIGNYISVIGNFCVSGYYAGISIYNGGNGGASIIGNKIISPTGYGIEISDNFAVIQGNYILNAGSTYIVTNAGLSSIISDNQIVCANNPTGGVLINLNDNRGTASNNLLIVTTGNTAAISAISLDSDRTAARNNTIFFNTNQAHKGVISSGHTAKIVTGNHIYFTNLATTGSYGMQFSAEGYLTCNDNYIERAETGIDLGGSYDGTKLVGNTIYAVERGIDMNSADECVISGNSIVSEGTGSTQGIYSSTAANNNSISGNLIKNFYQDGIVLTAGDNNIIANNEIITSNQTTNNTNSAILLTGTATYTIITGNYIHSTGANDWAYGIREASTADGPSIITNNIVRAAATAQISTQHASSDVSHNITA